jgi:integrase
MGLGPTHTVTLKKARQKATELRNLLYEGKDPLQNKRSIRAAQALEAAKAVSFDQCAKDYIKAHRTGWKNAKHISQWENTIKEYCAPVFGKVAVQDIDTSLVLKALEPVWKDRTETASRLRGRIEAVLDFAKVKGFRSGENPARWRGHLDHLLSARNKVQKVEHHAAMPYADLPDFMANLRRRDGVATLALEFLILTAARSGEVRGAQWSEIDLAAKVWIIPEGRMKGGREHRIALSDRAVAILERLKAIRRSEHVFPGDVAAIISEISLRDVMRRMDRAETVHGFRSTFRTWASECTSFPREVAEAALSHVTGSKVELAYQRSDLLGQRVPLMAAWAAFCNK